MNDRPQQPGPHARNAAVVMGVAGCGKSVIGSQLAARLGWRFIEGDRLHPPDNIARMSDGLPLNDEMRRGWLDRIGEEIAACVAGGEGAVAACSALKRVYRDRLRSRAPGIVCIHPEIDAETARRRVALRSGHFMPASLVDSQFADLQPPEADEAAIRLDGSKPVEELVEEAMAAMRERMGGRVPPS